MSESMHALQDARAAIRSMLCTLGPYAAFDIQPADHIQPLAKSCIEDLREVLSALVRVETEIRKCECK